MNECVFSTFGDFLQVDKGRVLRSNVFTSNSVSNRENVYGDFSDVATGLCRGLFEPYTMSRVVPAFQIGQNVHRRRPQIWTAFHVNGRRSEKVLAVIRQNRRLIVRKVAEELGICKNSCHLILNEKKEDASCCRKICAASADPSLLIHEFLTKHETTVVPPAALLSRFGPCGFFLIAKWKSSLKGRRFQTVDEIEENSMPDLRAVPQNTFQDALQKWKIRWERCIKNGAEYFEGGKFD